VADSLYGLPETLSWWCSRLRRVRLECLPWQELIDRYDRNDALLYCDPPYHPDTCNGAVKQYRHTMSAQDHVDLLVRLRRCRSRVLLCGYSHSTYDELLADWVQLQTTTRCRIGNCGSRIERVRLNYDPPTVRRNIL
jgi:DNA adenine methylase